MKTKLISIFLILLIGTPAQAQGLGDWLRGIFGSQSGEETPQAENTPDSKATTILDTNLGSILSQADAETGLKEALVVGARAVSSQLSATDGYFADDLIQIPLPGDLQNVQKQLSRFGLSGPLDDLQLRMNRAAEKAAPSAANLVIDAVESLTIEDALALLNGGDTAATDLLRSKTESQLSSSLRPYVVSGLEDAGALNMLEDVAKQYGQNQLGQNLRDNLIDHAVEKALDGMFFYLAKEEQEIRKDPVKRSTDILRRVFGG